MLKDINIPLIIFSFTFILFIIVVVDGYNIRLKWVLQRFRIVYKIDDREDYIVLPKIFNIFRWKRKKT